MENREQREREREKTPSITIQFSNEMAALNVLLFIYIIIFILLLHLTLNPMLRMFPDDNFEWKYSILLSWLWLCTLYTVECVKCIAITLHDCALCTVHCSIFSMEGKLNAFQIDFQLHAWHDNDNDNCTD